MPWKLSINVFAKSFHTATCETNFKGGSLSSTPCEDMYLFLSEALSDMSKLSEDASPVAKPYHTPLLVCNRGRFINESITTDISSSCLAPISVLNPDATPFTENRTHIANPQTSILNHDVDDSSRDLPYSILQNLRVKNVDKIIIGHININSVRNKFYMLADLIQGRVDVLLIHGYL